MSEKIYADRVSLPTLHRLAARHGAIRTGAREATYRIRPLVATITSEGRLAAAPWIEITRYGIRICGPGWWGPSFGRPADATVSAALQHMLRELACTSRATPMARGTHGELVAVRDTRVLA
jgi:hypothetical protein